MFRICAVDVCQLVCRFVMSIYFEKMADSIQMPFALMGQVDLRNHVLDGGQDPQMVRGNLFVGNEAAQCNIGRM